MADFERESMLESFIYEMGTMLNSLEATCLQADNGFTENDINEVFRVMHTIKGASAMMQYDNLEKVSHVVEDLFFYLREEKPKDYDSSSVVDITFESMDFIRQELSKIESGDSNFEPATRIVETVSAVVRTIKGVDAPKADEQKTASSTSSAAGTDLSESSALFASLIENTEISDEENKYVVRTLLEEEAAMKTVRMFNVNSKFQEQYSYLTSVPAEVANVSLADDAWDDGLVNTFSTAENFEFIITNLKKLSDIDYIDICCIHKSDSEKDKISEFNKYDVEFTFLSEIEESYANIYAALEVLETKAAAIVVKQFPFANKRLNVSNNINFTIIYDGTKDDVETLLQSISVIGAFNITNVTKGTGLGSGMEEIVDNAANEIQSVENSTSTNEVATVDSGDSSKAPAKSANTANVSQVISVSVSKLDQLLNLIRELVISESMVTHNPDLENLNLESFHKDARQLRKITNDVQDLVMSMRMVPLSKVFFKFNRIVRDMSKALGKEVNLDIVGEETEVDKNIIEHISDPLMHMFRNSMDHGLETTEERIKAGKDKVGVVRLEAINAGSEVLIILSDDGKGLDKDKILAKAKKNGLLKKDESEYSEKEIFQFIFLPGFSTNEQVTSYSGRGVGMDVVTTNIIAVGGSIDVNSARGVGTTFTLKIPLTLAIIDGMLIHIGNDVYTLPIVSIKQSFKVKRSQITLDPHGNEMITVRGSVFSLLRLSDFFGIEPKSHDIEDGIVIMVENGDKFVCLLADELIGEHQVVVKTLPSYIDKINGISGCTLLGSGEISIIIDINGLFNNQ